MSQSLDTSASAVTYTPNSQDLERIQVDRTDVRIALLKEKNHSLKLTIEKLRATNADLKEIVNSTFASPSQKRLMLCELEQRYDISRRHACTLLNLARSTCWYKSPSTGRLSIKPFLPRTAMALEQRLRLLKQIAIAVRAGDFVADDGTISFVEASLKGLGLIKASSLVRPKLSVAMEIFEVYLSERYSDDLKRL